MTPFIEQALNSANLAAWVQAIGSIAAILVSVAFGFWLHRLQVNAENRRAIADHLDDVRRIEGLLRSAAEKLLTIRRSMDSPETLQDYLANVAASEHLHHMNAAMGALTAKDAPTAPLLMLLLDAREAYEFIFNRYRGHVLGGVGEWDFTNSRELVTRCEKRITVAADQFDRYIKELAGRARL